MIAWKLDVSERTIRRWKQCYNSEGVVSLVPKKRGPKNPSNKTKLEIEAIIVKIKLENPGYGARRPHWYLLDNRKIKISHMTISRLLKRRGISMRIKPKNLHTKRFERRHANSLWQMDTLQFRIKGIGRAYIFAAIDDHSRFCVACKTFTDKEAVNSLVTLTYAVVKHGMPKQLLTDNGTEVIEEVFENYLARKGINHIRCRPYTPQAKGKIERFFGTLYRELIIRVFFVSLEHAQQEIDKFIHHCNYERRHSSLGWKPPAER